MGVSVYKYGHKYMYIQIKIYTSEHTYICMYVCICLCICVRVCCRWPYECKFWSGCFALCQTAKTNHEKDVTFIGIGIGMQNLFSSTHALHALSFFYTRQSSRVTFLAFGKLTAVFFLFCWRCSLARSLSCWRSLLLLSLHNIFCICSVGADVFTGFVFSFAFRSFFCLCFVFKRLARCFVIVVADVRYTYIYTNTKASKNKDSNTLTHTQRERHKQSQYCRHVRLACLYVCMFVCVCM